MCPIQFQTEVLTLREENGLRIFEKRVMLGDIWRMEKVIQ
jgi:hypothetical protein